MAGIYIHIPFCRKACHYCDFHFSTDYSLQNAFITALLKEIELQRPYLQGETVETIYFGGGTPSLLASTAVHQIMNSILNSFRIGSDPEITFEANPDDIDALHLKEWKAAGINRLSMGVQSFFKEDLLWMNRIHDENQAMRAIE
ncbi:MAG: radical SAM protein, partial [Bacteroidota bacterium]|nr:radical SAM protein [Bacteroidota bacterium]